MCIYERDFAYRPNCVMLSDSIPYGTVYRGRMVGVHSQSGHYDAPCMRVTLLFCLHLYNDDLVRVSSVIYWPAKHTKTHVSTYEAHTVRRSRLFELHADMLVPVSAMLRCLPKHTRTGVHAWVPIYRVDSDWRQFYFWMAHTHTHTHPQHHHFLAHPLLFPCSSSFLLPLRFRVWVWRVMYRLARLSVY
jgi:hypothetical protein